MRRARRNRYSAEFKAEAVRLVRASSDLPTKVARDLGINPETLRLWVQAARPPSEVPLTDDERGELKRLRREVRELRMERDILKKATAFFARQSE
jgi:transposase